MEIIKIYQGRLINARELHEFLEVKTEFRHWIKRMLEYGFEENRDYVQRSTKKDRQTLKEYFITLNMAKEVSMLQRSEKGKQARKYFIACEERLNAISQGKRFEAFAKLEVTKGKLKHYMINAGHLHEDYLQVDVAGSQVLMNGKLVPDEELNLLLLKARDFSTELTNEILKKTKVTDLQGIEEMNKDKHQAARDMLLGSGIRPEELPPEQNLKALGGTEQKPEDTDS